MTLPRSTWLGALISPILTIPPLLWTRLKTYTERAASTENKDILPARRRPNGRGNSRAKNLMYQTAYFFIWLSSAQKGCLYMYGVDSAMFHNNPIYLRLTMDYTFGMFAHQADLAAEAGLGIMTLENSGGPEYSKTIGKYLDASGALIPVPSAISPGLNRKFHLKHFCVEMYGEYRAIVHYLAVNKAMTAVFGLSTLPTHLISSFFAIAEEYYANSYNKKIAKAMTSGQPEGLAWGLLKLFNNRVAKTVYDIVFLKPLFHLLAIPLSPKLLLQLGKMLGSGLMGTAGAEELRKQLPELINKLTDYFGHPIDFTIPGDISWDSFNAKDHPGEFSYLCMLIFMTGILIWNGRTQFLAAKEGLLNGRGIGINIEVIEKFEGGVVPADDRSPRQGVQHRAKVVWDQVVGSCSCLWKRAPDKTQHEVFPDLLDMPLLEEEMMDYHSLLKLFVLIGG